MDRHVSIVGGGIAGLTLACHLQKTGIPYAVFEQAPNFKTVGAGIILANNAMQVFQKLGLADELSKKGQRISYLNLVDEQLNILASSDLSPFESKYGVNNISTVNNSNLPANIKNPHHHFARAGKLLKLLTGFKLPNAGPTLPKDDAAPPMADSKSNPKKPNTKAPIINSSMYNTKNPIIL